MMSTITRLIQTQHGRMRHATDAPTALPVAASSHRTGASETGAEREQHRSPSAPREEVTLLAIARDDTQAAFVQEALLVRDDVGVRQRGQHLLPRGELLSSKSLHVQPTHLDESNACGEGPHLRLAQRSLALLLFAVADRDALKSVQHPLCTLSHQQARAVVAMPAQSGRTSRISPKGT